MAVEEGIAKALRGIKEEKKTGYLKQAFVALTSSECWDKACNKFPEASEEFLDKFQGN